jgi:hypothetical protein
VKPLHKPNDNLSTTISIADGTGYSSDLQTPASKTCYKTSKTTSTDETYFSLDQAVSMQDIANLLQINISTSNNLMFYNTNPLLNYFNIIQETSYNVTLNYYSAYISMINEEYVLEEDQILSEEGETLYRDIHNYTFRLECGDSLISSYNQGAVFIVSAILTFDNPVQKAQFMNSTGLNVSTWENITDELTGLVAVNNYTGTISLTAFQYGGDSTALKPIVDTLTIKCNLTNMTLCANTTLALYLYAKTNFLSQIADPKTLQQVTFGGYTIGQNLSDILTLSPSPINSTVQAAQAWILTTFLSYSNWSSIITQLIESYPVSLESDLLVLLNGYINDLNSQVQLLLTGPTQGLSTNVCFQQDPTQCIEIANMLQLQIITITFQILNEAIMELQYYYVLPCVITVSVVPIGVGNFIEDPQVEYSSSNASNFTARAVTVTPFSISGNYYFQWESYGNTSAKFYLSSTDLGQYFEGPLSLYVDGVLKYACDYEGQNNVTRVNNPYFVLFE